MSNLPMIPTQSNISNFLVTISDDHCSSEDIFSMEELEHIFGLHKMLYILKGLHPDLTATPHF